MTEPDDTDDGSLDLRAKIERKNEAATGRPRVALDQVNALAEHERLVAQRGSNCKSAFNAAEFLDLLLNGSFDSELPARLRQLSLEQLNEVGALMTTRLKENAAALSVRFEFDAAKGNHCEKE